MTRRDEFAEFVTARSPALHRAAYLMVGDASLPTLGSGRTSTHSTTTRPTGATSAARWRST